MSLTLSAPSPYIPRGIGEILKNPCQRGQGLHFEMRRVIYWLAGTGLDAEGIWRVMEASNGYAKQPEADLKEIKRLVKGAVKKLAEGGIEQGEKAEAGRTKKVSKDKITPAMVEEWRANAEAFLNGRTAEVVDLHEASPIKTSPLNCQLTFLESLFAERHIVAVNNWGYGGADTALYLEGWRKKLRLGKRITGKKGAWFRPNPVKLGTPSGENNTYADTDVAEVLYGFLENDHLPLSVQLNLFAFLQLPIVAITDSGGKSYHAILRLVGNTDKERREWFQGVLDDMWDNFGYDPSNSNPSKYTRLAGAYRDEGRRPEGDGEQRLIYLATERNNGESIL